MLPNLGRDVTSMAVLQPALRPAGIWPGSYQDANTYMLDGANITDDMGGNTVELSDQLFRSRRKPGRQPFLPA